MGEADGGWWFVCGDCDHLWNERERLVSDRPPAHADALYLATLVAVHKLNRSRLIEIQRVANLSWARRERLAGDVRRRRAL